MLIRYFAGAAEAAGAQSTHVNASDMDAGTLVQMLGRDNPDLERILKVSSLLADGVRVSAASTSLADVSQLDVLPPFAGG